MIDEIDWDLGNRTNLKKKLTLNIFFILYVLLIELSLYENFIPNRSNFIFSLTIFKKYFNFNFILQLFRIVYI